MKRTIWALWWLLAVAACGDENDPFEPVDAAADAGPSGDAAPPTGVLLDDLRAIPGMGDITETGSAPSGYRAFDMTYEQPVDHADPAAGTFRQRLRLLSRATDAPMVLLTEGYGLGSNTRDVVTATLAANQVMVEHRFFGPSRPASNDFRKLDIWQAASDHHRVVQALKWIYGGAWINQGGSKSGMAALYHRRFFPDDAVGTVADVAPLSLSQNDPRYVAFVASAGPSATCRQRLVDFQRAALSRRGELMPQMTGSYDHLGKELAFEHAVLELPFFFWQYGRPADCSVIPATNASATTLFAFLDDFASPSNNYGDAALAQYAAYYVQAEAQLGYPALDETQVADLLQHPGTTGASRYVPAGVSVTYDPTAMEDVARWVRDEGERLIFVYGEYDPWTAGAVDLGPTPRDSYKLVVPAGNHFADILDLAPADRAVALDALSRWTGVPIGAVLAKPGAARPEKRERPRTRL